MICILLILLGKFKPSDTLDDVYKQVKQEAGLDYDFKFRVPPSNLYSRSDMSITLKEASMFVLSYFN